MEESIVYILINPVMPVGSVLRSNYNDETCTVLDERKIVFRNEQMSLTRTTKIKLENSYWIFDGRKLSEIYNEVYSD